MEVVWGGEANMNIFQSRHQLRGILLPP